ncbi:PIR Superfamily Protein [Plasmodium ovale curtisi]|uniref:PIR Superfamily Protein n=1 Tax=Plasmodium ovale curtisi TaxID=864141 RepID=A0A1A8WLY5_PLAOA|nr:PIR Superfamily Protein [Plasmodium ovale curtisi]
MGRKLSVENYYNIFFKIRDKFNNVIDDDYVEYLYREDQVLLNIALYLLENFKGEYIYSCKEDIDCKERCTYLNKWLNEKKALYTSNTKCKNHNDLWGHYIERLWEKMQEGVEQSKRCQREVLEKQYFQDKWIIPSCKNENSVEMESSCPETDMAKKEECSSVVAPTSSSCKTVLTTTYVIFGILLFSIYLLRFSSVGMKLNKLIRGKNIKRRNMDKEINESFRSRDNTDMESLDRRFNVIYNSLQN